MESVEKFSAAQLTLLAIYGEVKGNSGAKFWRKLADFSVLALFAQVLLIKNGLLLHFLVKLIYGGFWKIFCCPRYPVGDL